MAEVDSSGRPGPRRRHHRPRLRPRAGPPGTAGGGRRAAAGGRRGLAGRRRHARARSPRRPLPGPFLDACRASRDLWGPWVAALEAETGLSVDYDTSGALLVALDEEDEAELDRIAGAARELGEQARTRSRSRPCATGCRTSRPGVRRALHLPGEHRVDNVQLCAVLAQAVQKLGVALHYDSEVERVERRAPEGTVLVSRRPLAQGGAPAGARRRRLERPHPGAASPAGAPGARPDAPPRRHRVALERQRPAGARLRRAPRRHRPPGRLDRRGGRLRQAQHGRRGRRTCSPSPAASSRASAHARLETVWAGLRPGTPDDLPILGPLPGWPVLAATGHFRNGILLAPWTAREVARLALRSEGSGDPALFAAPFLARSWAAIMPRHGGLQPL